MRNQLVRGVLFSSVFGLSVSSSAAPGPFDNFDPFCFGSAGACPCGNVAPQPETGCMNSFGNGARLSGSGNAQVTNDTVTLSISGVPTTAPVFFVQADARVNNGLGLAHGDGLRCVEGVRFWRIGSRSAVAGQTSIGFGTPNGPVLSVRGGISAAGETMNYAAFYRNSASFCTPAGFNWSNAIEVQWSP